MALLPLAALAQDITVTPYQASKTYGETDPGTGQVKTGWFATSDISGITGLTKNAVASALTFWRITPGEAVGTYTYSYEDDATVNDGSNDHDLIINGSADFYIRQKDINTFTEDAAFTDLASMTEGHIALVLNSPIYTDGETERKPGKSDITIYVKNAVAATSGVLTDDQYEIVADGYSNNVSAGTATLTITGKGNYTGTKTLNFTILKTQLTGAVTYVGDALYYNGSAQQPTVDKFKVGDLTTGFSVKSYANNTNAGTATVVLQGDGTNYDGEVEGTFTINPYVLTKDIAYTVSTTTPQYTGSAIIPTFTLLTTANTEPTGYANVAISTDDYEITNASTNASTTAAPATAKINFKRNFAGSTAQTIEYQIAKRTFNDGTVTVAWTTKDDDDNIVTQYEYKNANWNPPYAVTFKPSTEADAITLNTSSFNVAWKDASDGNDVKTVGTGKKLVLTGKGNFTDATITLTFDIVKRNVVVTANDITVAIGNDINPTAVYQTLASGHNATNLGITPVFKYVKLDADGNETSTEVAQADIYNAAIGSYHIVADVAALNTQAGSASTDLKYYTFSTPAAADRATLTKNKGQIVVKVKDREIDYGTNFPNTGWAFEHVSGLSEDNIANLNTIIGTIDQNKFKLVTAQADPLNANATGYDVTYDNGQINNGDYAISIQTGKLVVNKKAIADSDITINGGTALTYTGAAQYPEVNVTVGGVLLPTNYYTTDYDESYEAGARTAKVSISGDGANNYVTETKVLYVATDPEVVAGTASVGNLKETLPYVQKTYTINKKTLTIAAADFTGAKAWTYGTEEPDYNEGTTITGFVSTETAKAAQLIAGEKPEGFNGKLVVKRTSAAAVGTHADALKPVFVDDDGAELAATAIADNYTYTAATVTNGDLTINKGKIVAKVKDIIYPYGEKTPTFSLEAVSGMDPEEAANFDAIVTYDHALAKYSYNYDNNKEIGSYTIQYNGAAPTATNYDVEYAEGATAFTGTLTVVKRPVKFTAANKTVDYSSLTATWEENATKVNTANITQNIVDGESYSLLSGDKITDLIASVAFASKNIGANDIVLTAKTSTIYDITVVNGTLTINDTGVGAIVLNRVAKASYDDAHTNTAAKLIEQNDGKIVNVTFSDFPIVAEKWYPMVLPFATTVKDISAAFGYAVVDKFDGTDTDGNIQFKLHMGAIEANTPFIVKVYEDQSMSDATVKFNNVTIVDAMDDNKEVAVGDATGVQFVGTYAGRVDGFRSNMYYFSTNAALNEYYKGNDTNKTYLRPLGAYFLDNSADAASANRMIIIEEPNGNTTKISAITAEGASIEADGWYTVSGVKLEGAPTEKGVYIRNGKKVVLK